jgi:hypothetical protein
MLVMVASAGVVIVTLTIRTSLADASSVQDTKTSPADTSMTLKGGQEGTVFRDLVVEGEDRIQIDFERPELHIDVDPQSAPGLEWGNIQDVLDRNPPDFVSSYLEASSMQRSPYRARPWLNLLASGEIVQFRPQVEGVDRWELIIANSRGETVASFDGKGKPPKEIGWDGRSLDGTPVPPGLTYSYVLEAYDRAGNKRSFVGEGFNLPSYRLQTSDNVVMLFSGRELSESKPSYPKNAAVPPAILLEVVDQINESRMVDQPVLLEVSARTYDQAKTLSGDMVKDIEPLVLGGSKRIQPVTNVVPDAPGDGTIRVVVPR